MITINLNGRIFMQAIKRIVPLLIFFALMGWPTLSSATTYGSAMDAWERGDFRTAFREFTELSRENNPYAQYMLGKMYANGEGTHQDDVMAYVWLHLSESSGIHQAGELKSRIKGKMSRDQLARAMDVVNKWQQPSQIIPQRPEYLEPAIVRRVQQALKDRGYFRDRVDGIAGRKTRDAIRWLQQDQGMVADGRISDDLLNRLNIDPTFGEISDVAKLQKKLRKLLRKAKQRNAAEPWLIQKLEKLANVQTDPWPRLILNENFTSKDYERSTGWQTVSGNIWLEKGKGLVLKAVNSWSKPNIKHKSAEAILMEKRPLNIDYLKKDGRFVKIQNDIRFSNGFAFRVETKTLREIDALILSGYLDETNSLGYQLIFQPGKWDTVKLFKVTPRTRTEIQSRTLRLNLAGAGQHRFAWTRSGEGRMTVFVDSQKLFEVNDNTFDGPFENIGIAHMGDQVVLQSIMLHDDANPARRFK